MKQRRRSGKTDANNVLTQFQKQLDKVERLVNSSMRPLISQKSPLDAQGTRQALETLERWSELYRHGLKAAGNVSGCGAEWLYEARQRLDLTASALKTLDMKSERLATKARTDKGKHLLRAINRMERIIIPIAE